ncbi:hypothetical protein BGY98DRAFT_1145959 [Russula aff. rugulosa BPL654]|nr:hypothetical protein BGY98DRAFT_1145959 [Russula aff. rugulosa BPL654]
MMLFKAVFALYFAAIVLALPQDTKGSSSNGEVIIDRFQSKLQYKIVCEVAAISRVNEIVCFSPFSSAHDPKTCAYHGNWVDVRRDETLGIAGMKIRWFEYCGKFQNDRQD